MAHAYANALTLLRLEVRLLTKVSPELQVLVGQGIALSYR